MLLFNEADSLFGKRTTDVKSSNDRYANLKTTAIAIAPEVTVKLEHLPAAVRTGRAVAKAFGKERSQIYKLCERLGIDYKAFRPKA